MIEVIKVVTGYILIDENKYSFSFATIHFDSNGSIEGALYFPPNSPLHKHIHQNLDFSLFNTCYSIEGVTSEYKNININKITIINYGTSLELKFKVLNTVVTFPNALPVLPKENLILDKLIVGHFSVYLPGRTVYTEKEGLGAKNVSISSRNTHMNLSFGVYTKNSISHASHFKMHVKSLPNDRKSIEIVLKHSENQQIAYNKYLDFKADLFHFLSFINGRNVAIHSENVSYKDHSIKIVYPTNIYNSKDRSYFIPIELPPDPQRHPLNAAMNAFYNYTKLSKIYDLNSVIHILNDTINNYTLQQKYYSLITIVEMLKGSHYKHKYAKASPAVSDPLILEIIDNFKATIVNYSEKKLSPKTLNGLNRLKSMVGSMHKINKNSNSERIRLFFNDFDFESDDKLNQLIDHLRNSSVHEGEFGDDFQSRIDNLLYLDSIVRESILRIIDYKGIRNKLHSF